MRPRLITAENTRPSAIDYPDDRCFNEAAAHHRGERGDLFRRPPAAVASMRPRLITAENPCSSAARPMPPRWLQ